MPTAIFDIDGTLTDTNAVDDECYVAAVRDELGFEVGPDWAGTEDMTDAHILRAVWERETHDSLPPGVERRVVARFVELLKAALRRTPDRFRPIHGAREVFSLVAGLGWRPAIATGGWRDSAPLKLRAASIPYGGVPLSSSSDETRRAEIIRRLLPSERGGTTRDAVVCFGDGLWDFRAATELGLRFIGVGQNGVEQRLRQAGVSAVVPDLSDTATIAALLGDSGRGAFFCSPRRDGEQGRGA